MALSDAALRRVARFLPREFRERVFEPAYADLHLDEADPDRRPASRWGGRVTLLAECLRLATAQLFWYRRRPTRLTVTVMGILAIAAIVIQRINYGRR